MKKARPFRVLTVLLAVVLLVTLAAPAAFAIPPTYNNKEFKDLPEKHWAYQIIWELAAKHIDFGVQNGGNFYPDTPIKRQEFVSWLVQALGVAPDPKDTNTGFTDVPKSDATAPYIKWAKDNGVVNGISATQFGFNAQMSRQDLVTLLYRFDDLQRMWSGSPAPFTDISSVSDYARDAVEASQRSGIINGYADGSFRPKNSITRAEAAKVIEWFARFGTRQLLTDGQRPSQWPQFTGTHVSWNSSLYDELLDYAAGYPDTVVTAIHYGPYSVTLYFATQRPVTTICRVITFSQRGTYSQLFLLDGSRKYFYNTGFSQWYSEANYQSGYATKSLKLDIVGVNGYYNQCLGNPFYSQNTPETPFYWQWKGSAVK